MIKISVIALSVFSLCLSMAHAEVVVSIDYMSNSSGNAKVFYPDELAGITSLDRVGGFISGWQEEVGHSLTPIIDNNMLDNSAEQALINEMEEERRLLRGGIDSVSDKNSLLVIKKDRYYLDNSHLFNDNKILYNMMDLSGIEQINDHAYFDNNQHLNSLSGLDDLFYVAKSIYLNNNPSIINLDGLNSLREIGESIYLDNNISLKSLSGLNNIKLVEEGFFLHNNPSLVDISALGNISYIGKYLLIDRGIQYRDGFIPIPGSSWICQPEQSFIFRSGSAEQKDVCSVNG